MQKPYKIALMQLSRIGDIVMMLPLTRALKRTYPGCHITMIVREKYKDALQLFDLIDDVVLLKTQNILQPYLEDSAQLDQTMQNLDAFIDDVRSKNIDWLINLSFSPVSADLTYALTEGLHTTQTGYSRFSDGYIQFSGPEAQYFFSEVGAERENQIHLTEIFAKMTNTQFTPEDFACPVAESSFLPTNNARFYTVHLGASEEFKRAPVDFVRCAVESVHILDPEIVFCFIGSQDERDLAFSVIASLNEEVKYRCFNLCGQTSLLQVLQVMRMSYGHIGGDSLPVQLAMLSNTRVFLLSAFGTNFFETGPLPAGSMVYRLQEQDIQVKDFFEIMKCFVEGTRDVVSDDVFYPQEGLVKWSNLRLTNVHQKESLQQLAWFLYFDDELPLIHNATFTSGIHHLLDAHSLVIEHIRLAIERPEMRETLQVISQQVDAITEEIAKYTPHLQKVCQWMALAKSQIAPQETSQMLLMSEVVYKRILEKLSQLQSLGIPMSYNQQNIHFEETP